MTFRRTARSATERPDFMQELTNRVAEIIEKTGKLPWKREWDVRNVQARKGQ